jgi:hypothetical protein
VVAVLDHAAIAPEFACCQSLEVEGSIRGDEQPASVIINSHGLLVSRHDAVQSRLRFCAGLGDHEAGRTASRRESSRSTSCCPPLEGTSCHCFT